MKSDCRFDYLDRQVEELWHQNNMLRLELRSLIKKAVEKNGTKNKNLEEWSNESVYNSSRKVDGLKAQSMLQEQSSRLHIVDDGDVFDSSIQLMMKEIQERLDSIRWHIKKRIQEDTDCGTEKISSGRDNPKKPSLTCIAETKSSSGSPYARQSGNKTNWSPVKQPSRSALEYQSDDETVTHSLMLSPPDVEEARFFSRESEKDEEEEVTSDYLSSELQRYLNVLNKHNTSINRGGSSKGRGTNGARNSYKEMVTRKWMGSPQRTLHETSSAPTQYSNTVGTASAPVRERVVPLSPDTRLYRFNSSRELHRGCKPDSPEVSGKASKINRHDYTTSPWSPESLVGLQFGA